MRVIPKIRVTPLAYESLGVRSMCTLIETKDVSILADAGVSLGTRFRLMPHPSEYRALNEARARVENAAARSKVTTISHYHNDHHTPNFEDPVWLGSSPEGSKRIYEDRIILAKDFRAKINTAQRRRGWLFKQAVEEIAKEFSTADGGTFTYGRTTLTFSDPVPHGEGESELGWVIVASIETKGEKLVFAPDVQGPVVEETVQVILRQEPDIAIVGGPPTYLQGFKVGEDFIRTAGKNVRRLVEKIPTVVMDHHLLRDKDWSNFLGPAIAVAEEAGNRLVTASELLGQTPKPLEFKRRQLYEEQKPSEDFLKWAKLPKEKQKSRAPPIGPDA